MGTAARTCDSRTTVCTHTCPTYHTHTTSSTRERQNKKRESRGHGFTSCATSLAEQQNCHFIGTLLLCAPCPAHAANKRAGCKGARQDEPLANFWTHVWYNNRHHCAPPTGTADVLHVTNSVSDNRCAALQYVYMYFFLLIF